MQLSNIQSWMSPKDRLFTVIYNNCIEDQINNISVQCDSSQLYLEVAYHDTTTYGKDTHMHIYYRNCKYIKISYLDKTRKDPILQFLSIKTNIACRTGFCELHLLLSERLGQSLWLPRFPFHRVLSGHMRVGTGEHFPNGYYTALAANMTFVIFMTAWNLLY